MLLYNARSRIRVALTIFVIAATSGCVSGPPFEAVTAVPPDRALIYVYRPPVMHGAIYSPEVNIADQVKFPLGNGGYLPYFSMPGTLQISISNLGTRSITLEASAGGTYYVKGGTIPMGLGIPSIESVPAETGLKEIKECKRLPDVGPKK